MRIEKCSDRDKYFVSLFIDNQVMPDTCLTLDEAIVLYAELGRLVMLELLKRPTPP